MKKIINGLIYNADTAEEIGCIIDENASHYRYYKESLMKTQKGRFFLFGESGPVSQLTKKSAKVDVHGGYWCSEKIQPISEDLALRWCERNNIDADTVAEHFDIDEA